MSSIPLPALDLKTPQQPDLLQKYGQLMQLKSNQQQMQIQQQEAPLRMQALQQNVQSGALDIQDKQQQQAARQALNAAYSGAITKDASGTPSFDENKLMQGLQGTAAAYQTPAVVHSISEFHKDRIGLQTSATELQTKQADMIGSAASAVKAAGYDPTLAHSLLDTLPQSPQLDQIRQQIDNPQALKQIIDTAIQNSPKQRELVATEQKDAATEANQAMLRQQEAAAQKETQRYHNAEIGTRQQGLNIESARLKFEQQKAAASGVGPDGAGIVDAIGTGKIAPDRLGYLLARNPELIQNVVQKYPDFDSSKVAAYPQVYKDFTSSKNGTAGGTLNAAATAFQHLQELQQLNTAESRIPGTAAHQRYQNKVDTVAPELAKTYNDSTVSGIEGYKKTLNAMFNRDAAIQTQAQSMGDKIDNLQQTWENAAPSKSYQAPMPGMSQAAMAARAALDPRYKVPQQGGQGGGGLTVAAPNGKTYNFPNAEAAAKFKAAAGIQ